MEFLFVAASELHTIATPRRASDRLADQALFASIKERGVLVPLLVLPRPAGGYQVLDGARRLRAARKLGTQLPVFLLVPGDPLFPSDDLYLEAGLHVALQPGLRDIDRVDLVLERCHAGDTAETIAAWKKLRKDPEADPQALAVLQRVLDQLGIWPLDSFVEEAGKLLKLDDELLSSLREGALTSAQALALSSVKDADLRQRLLSRAERGELSPKQIRAAYRETRTPSDSPSSQGEAEPQQDGQGSSEGGAGATGIEDIENMVEERIRRLPRARQGEAKKYLRALRAVFAAS